MSNLEVVRFVAGEAPELMAQAWRLRHQVFREQLGWDVADRNLLEIDHFDKPAAHVAVMEGDLVVGYWRALPTDETYLLEESFPTLLDGPLPKSRLVWEISRFAVSPRHRRSREIGKLLVREIAAFGRDRDASDLIAVTDPVFERFVKVCGLKIDRIAGPKVVGKGIDGDVSAVVIHCAINHETLAGVGLATDAAAA